MRHPIMAAIAALVILSTAAVGYSADPAKIGVVDFQRVLKESAAGKAAQEEITRKGKEMEASLQEKKDEIDDLRSRMERESLVMNRDQREEKEREIRIKINDAKSLQKKYMEDFKGYEARLIQKIQQEFFDLVEEIGKQEGYTLILEKVGVLYAADAVDITDELIRQYDARRRQ